MTEGKYVGWVFAVADQAGDKLYAVKCDDIFEAEDVLREYLSLDEDVDVRPTDKLLASQADTMSFAEEKVKGPF